MAEVLHNLPREMLRAGFTLSGFFANARLPRLIHSVVGTATDSVRFNHGRKSRHERQRAWTVEGMPTPQQQLGAEILSRLLLDICSTPESRPYFCPESIHGLAEAVLYRTFDVDGFLTEIPSEVQIRLRELEASAIINLNEIDGVFLDDDLKEGSPPSPP